MWLQIKKLKADMQRLQEQDRTPRSMQELRELGKKLHEVYLREEIIGRGPGWIGSRLEIDHWDERLKIRRRQARGGETVK